jgi:hypothetical protein
LSERRESNMIANSMRDEMKDGIREILANYYKIDLLEVDADLVCSISDVAFSVCGISEKEQDNTLIDSGDTVP